MKLVFHRVENVVGKGENAGYRELYNNNAVPTCNPWFSFSYVLLITILPIDSLPKHKILNLTEFKPLLDDKILNQSKLNQVADNILKYF